MSNRYELTGTAKAIMDTQEYASGFTKREFVVTDDDPKYPQDIKFEVIKDKTTILDALQPCDRVTVAFNLRGNEYNGKYYTNLQAWRVTQVTPAAPTQEQPVDTTDHSDLDEMGF